MTRQQPAFRCARIQDVAPFVPRNPVRRTAMAAEGVCAGWFAGQAVATLPRVFTWGPLAVALIVMVAVWCADWQARVWWHVDRKRGDAR